MTPADLRALADPPPPVTVKWCDEASLAMLAAADEIERLHERLEYWGTDANGNRVWVGPSADGIYCRDETIRLLEEGHRKAADRMEKLEMDLATVQTDRFDELQDAKVRMEKLESLVREAMDGIDEHWSSPEGDGSTWIERAKEVIGE